MGAMREYKKRATLAKDGGAEARDDAVDSIEGGGSNPFCTSMLLYGCW